MEEVGVYIVGNILKSYLLLKQKANFSIKWRWIAKNLTIYLRWVLGKFHLL